MTTDAAAQAISAASVGGGGPPDSSPALRLGAPIAAEDAEERDEGAELVEGGPGGRLTGNVQVPDVIRLIAPPAAGTIHTCVGKSGAVIV